jgi:hypothetical protein
MTRRRVLVPEARAALAKMRDDVRAATGLPQTDAAVPEHPLTTEQAGRRGGPVGGEMVRRLVELALESQQQADAQSTCTRPGRHEDETKPAGGGSY